MIVESIKVKKTMGKLPVMDCFTDRGLVSGGHSALPDIDVDYASDRRQEIKEYLEERYNTEGRQRVFSAGTFTTLKLKAALKDVGRVHRIPHSIVNYITAILDDNMDWTDLFKVAAVNRKVWNFVQTYPEVIEDVRGVMGQPKASSIHASAIIVTPEKRNGRTMECFDFLPIRKMENQLVSEFDGYSVDSIGLLKEDVLATKELSKLSATINLVNDTYGTDYSIESITQNELEDEKTYRMLADGYTQNVFQFSSRGITRFIQDVQPNCIEDLIAINALYRPATLDIGATDDYTRYKRGEVAPVYNYGCYEATKNTFGIMCVAEDSPVVTMHGNRNIQDIRIGESVLTEDGTYQTVLAVIPKGEKETVCINTSFGEPLRCTADHRVLTQYGWVEAGKLDPKIHLVKAYWSEPCNTDLGDMRDWCLGLYLANGSSVSYPASIACRNREDAETVKKIFDSEFNLSSVVYHNVRCWYVRLVSVNRYNGSFSRNHKPNEFNKYLKNCGLKGVNVYQKRMPEKPSLMLLAGLIEGDGCIANQRVRLCNRELAKDLYRGLQAHRIPSAYNETVENGKTVFEVSFNEHPYPMLPFVLKEKRCLDKKRSSGTLVPTYYLETVQVGILSKSVRNNIRRMIAMGHKTYRQTVEKYGGSCEHSLWANVLSIKKDRCVRTWDLSIDKNHSFCVGGLIVHNCYQEQFMSIAHTLGGFDLGKTDLLRKAIGKKKADLMASLKADFLAGAIQNGCPDYEAEEIWHKIEVAGKYSFNRSHAAAYALTAFSGAWLKANYPTAFYTIALQWADDKEIPLLMSEMELCSSAHIVPPEINRSEINFFTDYQTDEIFWSLNRIKIVGGKTAKYIVEERERGGAYTSIENFIHRVFRYKLKKYEYWDDPDNPEEATRIPVNARHVKNLVLAGCFDQVEGIQAVTERYAILDRAAHALGFALQEKEFPEELREKHYFWSQQQIVVSGIGSIDYRRIFDNSEVRTRVKGKASYMTLRDALQGENEGKRIAVCATVTEVSESSYKDKTTGEKKRFGKLMLQQNNDLMECVCWNDFYMEHRSEIGGLKDQVVILTAIVRYSNFKGCNGLQTYKTSLISKL